MNRDGNGATPRLTLTHLSAHDPAGKGTGLRGVTLDLPPGRCLALLGDRQSSGSLLLDVVAGQSASTGGRIALDGLEIGNHTPRARRFGMVSPRDPLFPHLSVRNNIAFPLRAQGIPAAERARRVGEALALLGLEASAQHRPDALDDTVRIRTALARALVFDPKLILLDDPLATLDPAPRQLLQRTLRRLVRARGLTILLSTSDRDEAMLMGDEIGILHQGRLHQVGTASDLLDRPADPVVAQRLGDANLLTGRIIRLDDDVASVRLSCGHEMEAEPGEALEEGALCVLCVRPDRIATAFIRRPGLDTDTDSVPATLLEAVHLGDHLRLRFRLADGSELLVKRPPAAMAAELRPDRPALLAWQPHQARVFAAPV
jgi:putative spermidine/putrescine transport system ATP-binding protein